MPLGRVRSHIRSDGTVVTAHHRRRANPTLTPNVAGSDLTTAVTAGGLGYDDPADPETAALDQSAALGSIAAPWRRPPGTHTPLPVTFAGTDPADSPNPLSAVITHGRTSYNAATIHHTTSGYQIALTHHDERLAPLTQHTFTTLDASTTAISSALASTSGQWSHDPDDNRIRTAANLPPVDQFRYGSVPPDHAHTLRTLRDPNPTGRRDTLSYRRRSITGDIAVNASFDIADDDTLAIVDTAHIDADAPNTVAVIDTARHDERRRFIITAPTEASARHRVDLLSAELAVADDFAFRDDWITEVTP